jgi:hypothetical protein
MRPNELTTGKSAVPRRLRLMCCCQCGALVEVGSALAAGKRVYLVSPHAWSFGHHPNVRRFESLGDAVAAIVGRNKDCG